MAPTPPKSYSTFGVLPNGAPARTNLPHPQDQAWCLSQAFLSWVGPLMRLGHRKTLDTSDIWELRSPLQAEVVTTRFEGEFLTTKSIPKSFFRMFGWRFALTGVAFFLAMLCNLVGPVALNEVISGLTTRTFSLEHVATWVALLFGSQVFQALADNYGNYDLEVIAIQFVGAMKTLLYRKALKLSAASRKEKSTGDITNMYTADADSLLMAAFFVHQAWLIPLQIAVVSYMLYSVLDLAAFAGIAVIVVMLYLNNLVSKRMFAIQRKYRTSKDVRMQKVTEVFKSIGIVKFNAWEDKFTERIDEARVVELDDLLRMRIMTSLSIVLMWGMPVFISIASFGTFASVLHRDLTPAIVFTSIALFQLIQGPLRMITQIITMLIQSKVALERVSAFLDMQELDTNNVLTISDPVADEYVAMNVIIAVEDGEFGWDADTTTTPSLLRDVNLQIRAGEFYVVHGPVGCGKSSLCAALLGEMVKRRGRVFVGGSVAYCSQQPWIQNMTVRDNILFGSAFERAKYDKVLDACALTADLAALPAGDNTEIGERGVNVSGGQKARIALARACYSDADVYILDSPLSAVDAIVQNEIFTKCLLGLLRHKTIVLVTHNPEIIASTHITHAITIDETGAVVETRRATALPEYLPLVSPLPRQPYVQMSYDDDEQQRLLALQSTAEQNTDVPTFDDIAEVNAEQALASPFREAKIKTFGDSNDVGKLIVDEERSEGRVGSHVFAAYYHAVGGFPVVFVVLLSQMLWQGFQIGSDFWLSSWSSDSLAGAAAVAPAAASGLNATATSDATDATTYRLTIYAALGLASASMVLVRTLVITYSGMRAAKSLFDRMTHALMHAPMRFFDANPIGRILTRYGGDVSAVDAMIPFMFGTLAANLFSVGCSAATAAAVIQWKGLLLIPVMVLYYRIGAFYIRPARELQRLSKTTQAPVLNHLSETVDGGAVVRAFGTGQVHRFHVSNNTKLDANNKIWFAQLCVSQWFSLRIQLVGSLLLLVVTTSLVVLRNELSPAIIGLAFSYALKVSTNLEGIVRVLTRMETAMVSPERMQEYIDIPQEAPYRIAGMDPPAQPEWPSRGAIELSHVDFRYKEGDRLVLKDLSFTVQGGEKIGIVGRTGAGKSSLTMALFRINELASGSVRIDGVDVGKVGLKALREKLSIIPQNPVLFKGPLRSYLDPFSEFSDDELWHCVKQVGLSDRIASDEHKLECVVEENGENFSVGERQMLCMARALLRHSRIVIFDEATAAIDHETDKQLQQVIRTAFAKSTVLTIAHRLDTILDSDRILVLDGGHIVEFASPTELVQRGSGHFFELMKEGGYLDKFVAASA